jgi:hypothetical protein
MRPQWKTVLGILAASLGFAPLCRATISTPTSAWTFDEGTGTNTADIADSNPGTLYNGPLWVTDTPHAYAGNFALKFDGVNDRVGVGDPANLFTAGPFSVQAWVKLGSPTASGYMFADYTTAGTFSTFALNVSGSQKARFFWENPTGTAPLTVSTTTLTTGAWTQVVGTWDGTTRRLYINGLLEDSNSTAQSRTDVGQDSNIGAWGGTGGLWLNATIDEVGFWNYSLSQAEITDLYNNPLSVSAVPEPSATILVGMAASAILFLRRKRYFNYGVV